MNRASLRSLVVFAVIGIWPFNVTAQDQLGNAPQSASRRAPESRFAVIQRLGLNNPTLELTTAQRAKIDDAIQAYLNEQSAIMSKYAPMSKDRANGEPAENALQSSRDELSAVVRGLLRDKQRQTWDALQAARIEQLRSGMRGSATSRSRK